MISFHELTQDDYNNRRYALLLTMEERGDPSETPYYDSRGFVTIGNGFNIETQTVRTAVLRGLGFNVSGSNAVENDYIDRIAEAVNQNFGSDLQLQAALDAIMVYSDRNPLTPAPGGCFHSSSFWRIVHLRGLW